jgi:hypothetical protein
MRCPTCGLPVSAVLYRCGNCNTPLGPPGAAAAPVVAAGTVPVEAVAALSRRRQPLLGLGTMTVIAVWLATVAFVLALVPAVRDVAANREFAPGSLAGRPALAFAALSFVAWVLFITWLFLARRNVDTFPESMPRWAQGWAVAAWFIPVAGLLIGPAVVADVAYNSADDFGVVERRRLTRRVWRWWTLYVIAAAVLFALVVWRRQVMATFVLSIMDTGIWLSPALVGFLGAIGIGVAAAAVASRIILGISAGTWQRDERAAVTGHQWSTLGTSS